MGLPKNFQQTVNLTKRVDALNDLTFYLYHYTVKLTEKIIKEVYDNNKGFDELDEFLGEVKFIGDKEAKCQNRVSALNREQADKKINEWLNKGIEGGIIDSFEIEEVVEKTFNQELEDKKLLDILNFKGD